MSKLNFLVDGRAVWGTFRRNIGLFLALHLIAGIIVVAVLGPLLSILLGGLVMATGDAALTDQDILYAFLTPAGFALAMIGVAAWLTVTVFETAAMLLAVDGVARERRVSLARLFGALFSHLRGLFRLALGIAVRVVALVLPFLAVAGFIALQFLTEFDINFYLSERPPVFWQAGAAIALVLVIMAVVLLRVVAGWFLALPLLLLGQVPAGRALAESRRRLAGQRRAIIVFLLLWGAVFAALFAVSGAVMQFALDGLLNEPTLSADRSLGAGGSLRGLAWSIGAVLGAWSVVNLFIGVLASVTFVLGVRNAHRRWGSETDDERADSPDAVSGAGPARHALAWTLGMLAVVLAGQAWLLAQQLDGFRNDARPDIMAHRGASWDAPENTLAAIEEAIRQGADWVEIDVQETHDGRVLVAHDRDLMKVAGSPLRIYEAPFEELRAVDIGSYKDPRFADQRVPTFAEVLELARGRVKLNIELKYYGQEQQLEARVAELVERHGMAEDVVLMSLSLPGVRTMKALRPEWTVGLLSSVAVGDVTRLDADFLAVNAKFASRAFVERAQSRGKGVYTWTVNDPAGMSAMIANGVDGIITDRPALAQRVWEERQQLSVPERILVQIASRLGSEYAPEP